MFGLVENAAQTGVLFDDVAKAARIGRRRGIGDLGLQPRQARREFVEIGLFNHESPVTGWRYADRKRASAPAGAWPFDDNAGYFLA